MEPSTGQEQLQFWDRLSAWPGHAGADLLIAATAEVHRLVVATLNPRDSTPTGVRVELPGQTVC